VSSDRLEAARGLLAAAQIDALVVSRLENLRYLSGFTGSSAALLITQTDAVLVTDSRYAEQSSAESPQFRIEVAAALPAVAAARIARQHGSGIRVGFESEEVPYAAWEQMREASDAGGSLLVPCRGLVEGLRVIKSQDELDLIQRAVEITSLALEETLPLVRPGAIERDLALEIEFRMKNAGAEDLAFESIVASGPRASLPHGRASERRVGAGEFVVFDIGSRFRGYHSDMTRTYFTGSPDAREREQYETVLEAQRRGIEAVKPGVAAKDVDRAARAVIEKAGFGDRFGHGTGHGVGLQIHEAPRIGARSEEVLAAGMALTIEPGVYLPGDGGVRIEDIVVVTETGRRVLTPTPKDSWILG